MKLSILRIVVGLVTLSLPSGLRAAESRVDVSTIISKADAETILGTPVKDPAPRNIQGGDGYYSKCNYYGTKPGKTLLLRVYQAVPGHDAQKELELVTKDTTGVKSVSGLGEKAILTSGTASGLPARVLMLYVVKANTLVTIGLSGWDDEAGALEKAKSVAQKILAKL